MIYSRLLYTEHEHPHDEDGEGAYTVFSTQQKIGVMGRLLPTLGLQKFAVLWQGIPDTRIIQLIEESIVADSLSPVKLVHASKGTLTVVYNHRLAGNALQDFLHIWEVIADGVEYDSWTLEAIADTQVGKNLEGGRLFRAYAPNILATHQLGITPFTPEMFLFSDDWTPEAVFGADYIDKARTDANKEQTDSDFFDDVLPF